MNAIPSSKPNRRNWLALRFALIVVTLSALGAAYWSSRPSELVWWTSPPIAGSGQRARVLIPRGWELDNLDDDWHGDGARYAQYSIRPVNRTPWFLRWLFRARQVDSALEVTDCKATVDLHAAVGNYICGKLVFFKSENPPRSWRWVQSENAKTVAMVSYQCSNQRAFNSTYRQICNSLMIE